MSQFPAESTSQLDGLPKVTSEGQQNLVVNNDFNVNLGDENQNLK